MNIFFLVQEFYAIEAVVAMLADSKQNSFEPMRHSHERWYRDFSDFRDDYVTKFAALLFDYIVLVVAAELRHSWERASHFIVDYFADVIDTREEVKRDYIIYDAHSIIKAGIRMFDTTKVKWDSGFGGYTWFMIAKTGLMKDRVADVVFIDLCVNLYHNGGTFFDKDAEIFILRNREQFSDFLEAKWHCIPLELIRKMQGCRFNQLLLRARTLGIINVPPRDNYDVDDRTVTESLLFDYSPIQWGEKLVDSSEGNIGSDMQIEVPNQLDSRHPKT